jgi:hypothetical protein
VALNLLAIADGLAARFSAANVTPPTNPLTGGAYPDIRSSTARLTNNLAAFPCVEVYPPEPGDAEFVYTSGQRRSTFEFVVRFYYGKSSGDLERDMIALYSWWSVLINQIHGAMKLGLAPTVLKAIPTTSGIGIHTYGGVEYAVIEIAIQITTEDTVTLVP